MAKVCLIVPVRLKSERFNNKVLSEFLDKTVLQYVMSNVNDIKLYDDILKKEECEIKKVLALDTEGLDKITENLIHGWCCDYDFNLLLMDDKVSCGTERVNYVYNRFNGYDYYISLPADEPALNAIEISESINRALRSYDITRRTDVFTFFTDFYCEEDIIDSRSCKMVTGSGGEVLYTSRSVIPGNKNDGLHALEEYKKHVGVFIFPAAIASMETTWGAQFLSDRCKELESLEQNIFIARDKFTFCALKTNHIGFGIDTEDQIKLLENRLCKQ